MLRSAILSVRVLDAVVGSRVLCHCRLSRVIIGVVKVQHHVFGQVCVLIIFISVIALILESVVCIIVAVPDDPVAAALNRLRPEELAI